MGTSIFWGLPIPYIIANLFEMAVSSKIQIFSDLIYSPTEALNDGGRSFSISSASRVATVNMCVSDNKVVLDFCNLASRPPPSAVKQLVVELGLKPENLRAVVSCKNRNATILELASGTVAANIVTRQLKYQGVNIPLYSDDSANIVTVHDVPSDVDNESIAKAMSQYGEVLTIVNDRWRNFFPGVLNGVRLLRVRGLKATPKYLMVGNISATVIYKGQKSAWRLADKKKRKKSKTITDNDGKEDNQNSTNDSSGNSNNNNEEQQQTSNNADNDGIENSVNNNYNNEEQQPALESSSNNNNNNEEQQQTVDQEDKHNSDNAANDGFDNTDNEDNQNNDGFITVTSRSSRKIMKRRRTEENENSDLTSAKYYFDVLNETKMKYYEEKSKMKRENLLQEHYEYRCKWYKHIQNQLQLYRSSDITSDEDE